MANIKWYIPFASLNGTACRINIYDNDWPDGSAPLQLKGATKPFTYDDDKSDDLLNDVIRFRTGYISVVDENGAPTNGLRPASTFDRYVEVLYGSDVIFNGYIQVQDFEESLVPNPKVISLPVISPLGLFEHVKFQTISPPSTIKMSALLERVLASFPTYQRVYVPNIPDASINKSVFSLAFSPWNEDFHHSMTVGPSNLVMKPESYAYFIESLCKAYGWICHDTPSALVFTSFDYEQSYIYWPVGHIGSSSYQETDSTPTTAVPLTDFFTVADSNGKQNNLLPDTGIEMGYEGEFGNREFSFARTVYDSVVTHPDFLPEDGERVSVCNLNATRAMTEEIIGVTSTVSFNNDGSIPPGLYCAAWTSYIGILVSVSSGWSSGYQLFKIRLYEKNITGRSWLVKFKGMASYLEPVSSYSTFIGALKDHSKVEEYYISTSLTVNTNYVEVTFYYNYSTASGTDYPKLPASTLLFVHDITLEMMQANEPYAQYRFMPAKDNDTLSANGDVTLTGENPPISSSITLPISCYRLNDRMIGDTLMSTKITTYPYLFQPRIELVSKFRLSTMPSMPYLRKFSYLGKKWRLIAQSFNPWDDEFTLTMQYSPLLT